MTNYLDEISKFPEPEEAQDNTLDYLNNFPEPLGSNVDLRTSISEGLKLNSGETARSKALAVRHNVPVSVVSGNIDTLEASDKVSDLDIQGISDESPATAKFLSDPNNVSIYQHDIETLRRLESTLGDSWYSGMATTVPEGMSKTFQGIKKFFATDTLKKKDFSGGIYGGMVETAGLREKYLSPKEIDLDQESIDSAKEEAYQAEKFEFLSDAISNADSSIEKSTKIIQEHTPELSPTMAGVRGGIESLITQFPLIVASGITKSPAPMALGMGVMSFGNSYAEGTEGGLSHEDATVYASINASSEIITEYGPAMLMTNMLKNMGQKGFTTWAKKFMLSEVLGEQVNTVVESVNKYSFDLDKQMENAKTWQEKASIQAERQWTTLVATVVQGGTQTGVLGGINYLATSKGRAEKVESELVSNYSKGAFEQDTLDEVTAMYQTISEKSPEGAQEYIDSLKQQYPDMPTEVLISSRDLKDAFDGGELDINDPAIVEFYNDVLKGFVTNEDIAIPFEDYANYFAENGQIRDNVRLSEDGMSILDMQNAEPAMESVTSKMVEEAKKNADEYEESVKIYSELEDQLYATNRMSAREAKINASLMPAFMQRKAKEHGISIEEAYSTVPRVNVVTEKTRGDALLQAKESGYEGESRGEAQEWIDATAKGLDMSQEARMGRARDMGFDVDITYYHGTPDSRGIWESGFSKKGSHGLGADNPLFFTKDKFIADTYADDNRAFDYQNAITETIQVHLSFDNPKTINWQGRPFRGRGTDGVGYGLEESIREAQSEGHDAVIINNIKDTYNTKGRAGNVTVAFEPNQVRSINAAFDPDYKESADLLAQGVDQTETPEFKAWAKTDDDVIDGYDINATDFSQEKPYILNVYHGTTNYIEEFLSSIKGTKEGHFGQINYFTSSEYDAQQNYAGEGPDLTVRIEAQAERIVDDIQDVIDSDGIESAREQFEITDEEFSEDTMEVARNIARRKLHGGGEIVMELFVRTEKPFVVGEGAPFAEFIDNEAINQDAMEQVADENDITVEELQENIEEYEDQIDERRWEIESESDNELVEAIQQVAYRYDFDAGAIYGELYELSAEGGYTGAIEEILREKLSESYIEDPETGDLISSHVLSEVIQELGYDSIILKDADQQFSSMEMESATAHIHVFDADNTNIKSAENIGAFDPTDPNILRQENIASIERVKQEYIINLTKQSNRSSFLHESGHLFLDMERAFAEKFGVTKDQEGILKFLEVESFDEIDFFKYVDLKQRMKAGEDIGMTAKELDQRMEVARVAHEKFAEHFEAYLQTGKAPSSELEGAFRQFRNWLMQVYNSLSPYGITLSKDVTEMFDRMLATDDQIAEMEAIYQYEEDVDATESAKESLQSKLFKEFYRTTKKWWKEEKQAEMDAIKKELEKSDLYLAEEYIAKNKLNDQQVAEALGYREPLRSVELDPTKDSLLVAIAKLGGLDRAIAEEHGVDPENWKGRKNYSNSVVGISKPVFRKTKGRDLGGLFEVLGEMDNGYIYDSENDLIQAIHDELGGKESFSNKYKPDLTEYTEETQADYYDRKPKRLYGSTVKNGLDIDLAAQEFGFLTGEGMLRELAESSPINVEASNQAEEIMLDRHGDILNDGSLKDLARREAFNEKRGKSLLKEFKALAPQVASGINRPMLLRTAKQVIAQTAISELRPEQYHRKEVKAGQEYQQYKAENDTDMMIQAKMDQIINFYLYREARNAKEKAGKQREFLQKVKTKKYSAGTINSEYINHVKRYVSAFEFRKSPKEVIVNEDGTETHTAIDAMRELAKWVKAQNESNPEGYKPQFYHQVLADLANDIPDVKLKNYKDMTFEELTQTHEMTKHLLFIGRKLSDESKMEAKQKAYDVSESIKKHGGKSQPKRLNGKKRGLIGGLNSFGYSQMRAFLHVEELDGWRKDAANGDLYKNVWQPILDASDKHIELKLEMAEKIRDLIHPHNKRLRINRKKTTDLREFETNGENIELGLRERIMFVVYYGSPESRQTLLENGINDQSLQEHHAQAILDSLSDEDIKLVEGIWKLNESLREESFRVERKVNGIAPKAVEAIPFNIRGKQLSGGYQRIKYNPSSIDSASREDSMTEAMSVIGNSGISMTKAGAMNERVGSGGRTISLDFNSVTSALDEQIQFIAFAEASREVHQIMNNKDVKDAFIDKYGADRLNSFLDALNGTFVGDANNGHGADPIADFMRKTRSNMSMAMLMYSARNIVQQFVGGTNLMVEVSPMEYAKAAKEFMANPRELIEFVNSKSNMMRFRMKLTNREVTETANSLQASATNSKLIEHGYVAQTAIDKALAMPAWLASYRKGLITYNGNEKLASQYADEVIVSSLGSGQTKDLAPMFSGAGQKGNPLGKELLKQMSFMGSFFNIVGQKYYKSVKSNDLKTFGGSMNFAKEMSWTLIIPAIVSALVVGDIPDEEEWDKWAARKIAAYGFATVMGLREIASFMAEGFSPSAPYSNVLKSAGKIGADATDILKGDKDIDSTLFKNTIRNVSPFIPLPAGYQVSRLIDGLSDENQSIYEAFVEGKERNK